MDDDFAQSREPDDLFSDEIEPTDSQLVQEKIQAPPPNLSNSPLPNYQNQQRRGNGANHNHRGGRRGSHNPATNSTRKDQPAQSDQKPQEQTNTTTDSPPPTKPTPTAEPRITSVRGDRSATGPAKPTKKTEAELAELMKSMQLKSAAKAEAHARAEKDQASFLHREQQAAAKRVEERKAIREQDMERAKNRERKIKAQNGREWDSEKVETDIMDRTRGGSSMYSRGMHGGAGGRGKGDERSGLASSRYGAAEETDEMPSTGRGGRGRGRGRSEYNSARGGGRGVRGHGPQSGGATRASPKPATILDSDFPALQPVSKPETATTTRSQGKGKSKPPALSPGIGKGDWAEEMATPVDSTR